VCLFATTRRSHVIGLIHDYVLPISDLAKSGDRAVIFYDQLGNGRSTHLREKPAEFWTIDLFIDELINLADQLGVSKSYDICGHSWGGILAIEFLIRRQPINVRRFICSNTPAAIPPYMQDISELLSKFPDWVQEGWKMRKTDPARFREASEVFNAVHTINVVPFPKEYVDSQDSIYAPGADDTVVEVM
jgi:pimeloyl-ACP methyl ester carboxylesterase